MSRSRAEVLARESADWFHRGLISAEISKRLAERYDRNSAFLAVLGRWLGIFAVIFLGGSVLLLMGISGATPFFSAIILLLAAGAGFAVGIAMTTSKTNPFPVTGSALVTFAFVALFGALALLALAYGDADAMERLFPVFVLVVALCAAITAYVFCLPWPLFLAVLMLFHGTGALGWYGGRGSYYFHIQHPPSMALVAGLVVAVGYMHRLLEEDRIERYSGFGRIMLVFGLVYGNISLWFMSLGWDWRHDEMRLIWTLGFALAAIVQIVIGARIKDSTFTGFGVVFLAINLYTQFFERFWDKLSLAAFLAIAGLVGMGLGYGFEVVYRRRRNDVVSELSE